MQVVISKKEIATLKLLEKFKNLTIYEITSKLNLKNLQTSKILRRLQNKKLIVTKKVKRNRTTFVYCLSRAGRVFLYDNK